MPNDKPGKLFGHTRAWDTWASGELKARVWPCGLCHCFIWFGLHYCLIKQFPEFPHGNFIEFSGGLFWWNKILATIHLALALPPQLSPKQNIACCVQRQGSCISIVHQLEPWKFEKQDTAGFTWELESLGVKFAACYQGYLHPEGGHGVASDWLFCCLFSPETERFEPQNPSLDSWHKFCFTPCWSMFFPFRAWKLEPGEDVLLDIISGFLTANSIGMHRVVALVHRKDADHNRYTIDALLEA